MKQIMNVFFLVGCLFTLIACSNQEDSITVSLEGVWVFDFFTKGEGLGAIDGLGSGKYEFFENGTFYKWDKFENKSEGFYEILENNDTVKLELISNFSNIESVNYLELTSITDERMEGIYETPLSNSISQTLIAFEKVK